MRLRIPKRLRPGDCIGIVAPASPASSAEKIQRGIRYLENSGYRITVGKSVEQTTSISDSLVGATQRRAQSRSSIRSARGGRQFAIRNTHGYLSASDQTRADDINAMFADRNVQAIFCTRGGYGSPRILSLLDYNLIRRHPKIFVGYSDITALNLAFHAKCNMISFAGPMVAVEMQTGMDAFTEKLFWEMLTEPKKKFTLTYPINHHVAALSKGKSSGTLLGGNLSMLTSILGTRYAPRFDDSILFIEDVGEKVYRIDRMLAQLRNAGVFEKTNGILLGNFTGITMDDPSLTLDEVFGNYFPGLRKPVISNFPFGHSLPKLTLPIGAVLKVDAKTLKVHVVGPVVE